MSKKREGAHGGAWKVAYADFVTAMMALFMVLWISAQDQEILIATSRYFQNPFNSPMDRSSGVMNGDTAGGGNTDNGDNPPSTVVDMAFMNQLANELYRLLDIQSAQEDAKPIDVSVTADGLKITLFNRKNQPFFKPYTNEFTPWGELVVQNLAWLMDRYNTSICIDSFTGDEFHSEKPSYGPWELSSDRCNAMRRGLVHFALDPEKIDKVTSHVIETPIGTNMKDDDSRQRIEVSLVVSEKKK